MDSNGNQNGHGAVDKKKLNKRERKEARQQKNGKTVKVTKESATLEAEDNLAGKKKKKDRKRPHSSEQDEDDDSNGAEMTKKKKKTCKFNSKMLYISWWSILVFLFNRSGINRIVPLTCLKDLYSLYSLL